MYIFNKTIQNCPIKIFNFVTFQRDEEFVELYELIETTGFAYFHIVCRKFDMNPSLEQESMFIILLLISIKFLFCQIIFKKIFYLRFTQFNCS